MIQLIGMPAVQPSTDRPTSWVAPSPDAGHVEDVAEPDARPAGVADEVAADPLETQAIVTYCSTTGSSRRSA